MLKRIVIREPSIWGKSRVFFGKRWKEQGDLRSSSFLYPLSFFPFFFAIATMHFRGAIAFYFLNRIHIFWTQESIRFIISPMHNEYIIKHCYVSSLCFKIFNCSDATFKYFSENPKFLGNVTQQER